MSDSGVGELRVPDGCRPLTGGDRDDLDVAVVASRYNPEVVQRLLDGAVDHLTAHGIAPDRITVVQVPGAWELP
ncbi:MAG TPA: 6,7-dimethyl-8-ribityllumazine synthase, partial [Gaiellales bacterium]|nr:6,7-dimethyl-8-ribityllumazine synthase [Gaiellales bacterium]